ncbi:MAG TPA: tRNA 2-thiouridine(34) synthase MnmA [Armatimonadota bacterium]|nr:tRNA 2-thiouridine(34) synthase MnmA [Armatimonadota bacterium]
MERVVAAMSGGVDSAVAASLLVEQGYEVIGITMQVWPEGKQIPATARGCCSIDTVEDARRVAQTLRIPHYVLNMREDFNRTVIHDFIAEYRQGRTPNPCVECNRHVKFDALMERAGALGARWVATGHYARTWLDTATGRWKLFRGRDPAKDQSYVLYPLTQAQLSRAMFPLGDWTKDRARERAFDLGLQVAGKADSQEICFVPDKDYGRFLEESDPETVRPGKIVDTAGRIRGEHRGVAFFTVGQRKGLGVASNTPLYVTRIDPVENLVIVGSDLEVMARSCLVSNLNWIGIDPPESGIRVEARVRYNMREAPAIVEPADTGQWRLTFENPQRAITPGQSAVFYRGDETLGGGLIDSVYAESRAPELVQVACA